MDTATAELGGSAITGAVAITGLVLRQLDRWQDKRNAREDKRQGDRDDDSERMRQLRTDLRQADVDFAELRARHQGLMADYDDSLARRAKDAEYTHSLEETNRALRHEIQELRTECNKKNL